ncbi:MHO_4530 family protein [Mycoplasma phocoenae]|uniref:Uncharacterized protein n=1 Tax=Mycoplasma phocoenae TaxID=754517 RepID=A0A858U7N3_9MOLU|nr:hypothetical protein [Mycoplasma phocoenae]QJG66736.1 hypothetical protein HGG69_00090 [Mycoplasma phocoenae]
MFILFFLISIISLCWIIIVTSLICANKNNQNIWYGSIPVNIDIKQMRIKMFEIDKTNFNHYPFFKNSDFRKGKWISINEFSKIFNEDSKKILFNSLTEESLKKDTRFELISAKKFKKSYIKFTLDLPKINGESNIALFSWKLNKEIVQKNIIYRNNFSSIETDFYSYTFFTNINKKNIYKKEDIVQYICKHLPHNQLFLNYVIIKDSTLIIQVQNRNKKSLQRNYLKLKNLLNSEYVKELTNSIIFTEPTNNFKYWEANEIKFIDYLTYISSTMNGFFILGANKLNVENNLLFNNNYKKIRALLSKGLLKFTAKPVSEYLNKNTKYKILDPDLENEDKGTMLVINKTSLKTRIISSIFNSETNLLKYFYLVKINDYDFLNLKLANFLISSDKEFKNTHIALLWNEYSDIDILLQKTEELKSKKIKTVLGINYINDQVYEMIDKMDTNIVILTKELTKDISKPQTFLDIMALAVYSKNKKINVIFEDIDINDYGYQINKQLKEFFYIEKGDNNE